MTSVFYLYQLFRDTAMDDFSNLTFFSLSYSFTITDLFGCETKLKEGAEWFIFASLKEFSDDGLYAIDFAVDPTSKNTPDNFVQQLNSVKTNPPQCDVFPVF